MTGAAELENRSTPGSPTPDADQVTPIETMLRDGLTKALRARDRAAVRVLREALAALDNATAVPLTDDHRAGAVQTSAVGPGAAEVPRRELTDAQARAVVVAELTERRTAASELANQPERVAELLAGAELLTALLARPD